MSLRAAGIHLLTLPDEFDEKVVDYWIERIRSKRLRTIRRMQMSQIGRRVYYWFRSSHPCFG